MKKIFVFFALASVCLTAWRCSDKEEYGDIQLNVNALYIFPGMSYNVVVSGGSGEYTVQLHSGEQADLADLTFSLSSQESGSVLTVETHEGKTGVGNIVVTDVKSGKTKGCFLLVNADNFIGGYELHEQKYAVQAYPNAEEIDADLKNKAFPAGSTLFFNPQPNHDSYGAGCWTVVETNELNVIVDTLASGAFVSMPLSLNEISESYGSLPIGQQIHSAIRYVFEQEDGEHVYDLFYVYSPGTTATLDHFMYEDRTSYYQAKYPDAQVTAVVNRYVNRYGH